MTKYMSLDEKGITVTRNLTTELTISEEDARRIILEALGAPYDALVYYDGDTFHFSEVSVKWASTDE